MKPTFTQTAALELAKLLAPLQSVNTGVALKALLKDLGWDIGNVTLSDNSNLANLANLVADILREANAVVNGSDEQRIAAASRLIPKIIPAITAIRNTSEEIKKIATDNPNLGEIPTAQNVATRLFDFLTFNYLRRHQRKTFGILHIIGLAYEVKDSKGIKIKTIYWDRLIPILKNPKSVLNLVYKWENDLQGPVLLAHLQVLLRAFMMPGGVYRQSQDVHDYFNRGNDDEELRIPLLQRGVWPDRYFEVDLNICRLPADGAMKPGIAFYPWFNGAVDLFVDLGNGWKAELRPSAAEIAGLALQLRPPSNLTVTTNLLRPAGGMAEANVELILLKKSPSNEVTILSGNSNTSHFGYKDISVRAAVANSQGEFILAGEVSITDLTLVIKGSEGDGFIDKLLRGLELKSVSNITLGGSTKTGFYFRGSPSLAVTVPIYQQLGPLFLESVLVGVELNNQLNVVLATSFSVELGPIVASVKEIGIKLPIAFHADHSGNLGPIQIDQGKFKAPTGVGLSIDASGLSGGGFLDIDEPNKRYAGVLNLKFSDYNITAIGLINTVMPNGSRGYSMMINIGVIFSPPIALPYNLSLMAIGGLLGIHRTAVVETLRTGLRAKTLDSILFAENPIRDANLIINNMRSVFPVQQGRFIVAPMVKLGWANNVIQADICILVEFPSPTVIVLLGQIKAALPRPQDPVVQLNLDVLGVLEFSEKRLSIDATLYDSKILTYSLSGDSAVRLSWGSRKSFAMSIGGFHPAFRPPSNFPSLRRLTLNLASYENLDISCKIYQAITSNTLQFGAAITLHAEYSGATLDGDLGFEALMTFSPFSFAATMWGGMAVKYRGRSLTSVSLRFILTGPTPWRARGTASFSILAWDVEVDFDKSWGNDTKRSLPSIDPWPKLRDELKEDSCWGINLDGLSVYESLKTRNVNGAPTLCIHPAGTFELRQKLLPLDLELELYANAPVKNYKRFSIRSIELTPVRSNSPIELATEPLEEDFARGQFVGLSDAERLSKPSFEKFTAGTAAKQYVSVASSIESVDLEYENILIDSTRISKKGRTTKVKAWSWAEMSMRAERLSGAPIGSFPGIPLVNVVDEQWTVVDRITMAPVAGLATTMSRTAAEQSMRVHASAHPAQEGMLQVVQQFEIS